MYKSVINIIGGKMLFDSSWTWYFLLCFRGLFTGIIWQILPLLFIDNDFSWLASYTQALSCPACRKRKWTWVWNYQLTQLSSITLRRNQHASQCLCGVDLIIPPLSSSSPGAKRLHTLMTKLKRWIKILELKTKSLQKWATGGENVAIRVLTTCTCTYCLSERCLYRVNCEG